MSKWTDEQAREAFWSLPMAYNADSSITSDAVIAGRRILDLEDELAAMRPVVEAAESWRSMRAEYEALSERVQNRFADAGRPRGYSAWTDDEKLLHTTQLTQMLALLNDVQAAVDAYRAQKEGR